MTHHTRRGTLSLVAAGLTLAAGATGAAVTMQTSASAAAHPALHAASAAAPASASGVAGWQGDYLYTVPTGTTSLFFHYPCPSGRKANNGGFSVKAGSPNLIGNAARSDITPIYGEWGWTFSFPGGAAAGSQIAFNAYCK